VLLLDIILHYSKNIAPRKINKLSVSFKNESIAKTRQRTEPRSGKTETKEKKVVVEKITKTTYLIDETEEDQFVRLLFF